MTKRERVVAAIKGQEVDCIPSGFSLHFKGEVAFGNAAIDAHLDFFKETDTDILKVMNENLVPYMGEIKTAKDYAKVKSISLDDKFMQDQIDLTKNILERCDKDGFTMGTLHGICASAIHPLEKMGLDYHQVRTLLANMLREDSKTVLDGMQRITDGMCQLAREYIKMGLDAVYYASLGAEHQHFTDEEFAEYIEPFDKKIMSAIREEGGYCFLHICKDNLNMDRYKNYSDYFDVVNWGVYETDFSLEEGKKLFPNKTIMGGLPNRTGVLVDGTEDEIRKSVNDVISSFGKEGFILGADCTLATEQDLAKVKTAVDAARQ